MRCRTLVWWLGAGGKPTRASEAGARVVGPAGALLREYVPLAPTPALPTHSEHSTPQASSTRAALTCGKRIPRGHDGAGKQGNRKRIQGAVRPDGHPTGFVLLLWMRWCLGLLGGGGLEIR